MFFLFFKQFDRSNVLILALENIFALSPLSFFFAFLDCRKEEKKKNFVAHYCMLRSLRIIKTKVRFAPAPCFSRMQSTSEKTQRPPSARPSSSKAKTYAPQDLPNYDYDLIVVGGGSGGKKNDIKIFMKIFVFYLFLGLAAAKEAAKLNKNAKVFFVCLPVSYYLFCSFQGSLF